MMIVLALFTTAFVVYALAPFFEKGFRNRKLKMGSSHQENLVFRKEEMLNAMEDLEYDFKMKKMAEEDYRQLKEKMTAEALEIMKQIDQFDQKGQTNAVDRPTKKHRAKKVHS